MNRMDYYARLIYSVVFGGFILTSTVGLLAFNIQ